MQIQHNIQGIQKTLKLKCLRIIICWAGFTKNQIATINLHNENHIDDPILLICPTKETGKDLYTAEVFAFLEKTMNSLKTSKVAPKAETFDLGDLVTAFDPCEETEEETYEDKTEKSDKECKKRSADEEAPKAQKKLKFSDLPRADLQTWAKKNRIPANKKSSYIVDELKKKKKKGELNVVQ